MTPAARSGSPQPSPEQSASSRRTAVSVDTARSPARHRASIKSVPSRARCSTAALGARCHRRPRPARCDEPREREWPSFAAAAREGADGADRTGVRFGVVKELDADGISADVQARFKERSRGHRGGRRRRSLRSRRPASSTPFAAYYLILPAEASSNLARFDSVRYGLRVEEPGQTVEQVMAASREAGFGPDRSSAALSSARMLCRPAITTLTTAARRRSARSSSATSKRHSRRSTCADQPGSADDGVQARREDLRSAGDVRQRHHDDSGEPRRITRHVDSHGPRLRRFPDRSAADGADVRRRAPVPLRCGDRITTWLRRMGGAACPAEQPTRSTGAMEVPDERQADGLRQGPRAVRPVLGFEVHVELNTRTKMFSASRRTRPTPSSRTPHRTR